MIEVVRIEKDQNDATRRDGDQLRRDLDDRNLFYVNFSSLPRAGKTALLKKLSPLLADRASVAVILADANSYEEVEKFRDMDARIIQLRSGFPGFYDALDMGNLLRSLNGAEIVLMENGGSLDSSASIDSGAHLDIYIHSVYQGDERPLKSPAGFEKADLVIVNKMDRCDFYDFSIDRFRNHMRMVAPGTPVLAVSSLGEEGLRKLAEWILERRNAEKNDEAEPAGA